MRTSLLLAALLTAGCVTTPQPPTVQRVASAAQLAAYTGTGFYLLDHPEARPKFELALGTLEALLASSNTDPGAYTTALKQLPLAELKSTRAGIIIGAAILVWTEYESQLTPATRDTVIPIMTAVRDGLAAALEASAP